MAGAESIACLMATQHRVERKYYKSLTQFCSSFWAHLKVFAFSVATASTIRDAYANSKLRTAEGIDVCRMLEMAI